MSHTLCNFTAVVIADDFFEIPTDQIHGRRFLNHQLLIARREIHWLCESRRFINLFTDYLMNDVANPASNLKLAKILIYVIPPCTMVRHISC